MTTDTDTLRDLLLPGTIPGLLQEGAAVVRSDYTELATLHIEYRPGEWLLCGGGKGGYGAGVVGAASLSLDLTRAAGRWCAVRWLDDRPIAMLCEAAPCGPVMLGEILDASRRGRDMDTDRIGYLRDLVLRVAGVSCGR